VNLIDLIQLATNIAWFVVVALFLYIIYTARRAK
jgi:hypothetical protein